MELFEKYRKELKIELESHKKIENQENIKKVFKAFPHVPRNIIFAMYYAANYEIERCYNALLIMESQGDIDDELFISERKFCTLLVNRLQEHFEKCFDIETEKMKSSLRSGHKKSLVSDSDEDLEPEMCEESSDLIDGFEGEDSIVHSMKEEQTQIDYGTSRGNNWASTAQKGQKNKEISKKEAIQSKMIPTICSNEKKIDSSIDAEISQTQSSSDSFFNRFKNAAYRLIEDPSKLDTLQKSSVSILKEQSSVSPPPKNENGFKYKTVGSTKKPRTGQKKNVSQVPDIRAKENETPENQNIKLTVAIETNKLSKNVSSDSLVRNSTLENKESEFNQKRSPIKNKTLETRSQLLDYSATVPLFQNDIKPLQSVPVANPFSQLSNTSTNKTNNTSPEQSNMNPTSDKPANGCNHTK